MTIRVALHHKTHYIFDRAVNLSPHEVRLRPAAHARTPIESYSLKVRPEKHFMNWQQDPYGNWLARLVFPEKTTELCIEVDLVADMTVINPFDFFMESYAEQFPFAYTNDNKRELAAYLEVDATGPLLTQWLQEARAEFLSKPINTIDFLVALNAKVQRDISYLIRMEAGVQTPEVTLQRAQGSCRDSGWLLVQILRHFGIAARFASGYLIQLTADQKALDGPSGTDRDFTDLHAWCEAYLPGAGWIGLDPTSGLLAGEGHIPLACTAIPSSAAPVSGFTDVCESKLDFSMTVTRIHEDPRVTKPFNSDQWQQVLALGDKVDQELAEHDVRLTMGGEPTFVSVDDMDGPEWNYTAHSPKKLELATILFQRMQKKFAPGGLLHFGQGKWYPGEPLPRWALSCYWRPDGKPLWSDDALVATAAAKHPKDITKTFARALALHLGLHPDYAMPAYESIWRTIRDESQLPINIDPASPDLKDASQRTLITEKLLAQLQGKIGEPTGYVLPMKPLPRKNATAETVWASSLWPLATHHLYLVEGDSPVGFRLPLNSLPWVAPADMEIVLAGDPFGEREALSAKMKLSTQKDLEKPKKISLKKGESAKDVVRTALCVEVRNGILHVFFPPLELLEDYLALLAAVEAAAKETATPVRIEGYTPPSDDRIRKFAVTPDPGVIEFNIQPSHTWRELVSNTKTLYEEARLSRLGTEKFMLDGKHTGTGGGNHVTVGGNTPKDSPMLRRPDLLRSLITYWQNHPALSYLFSGTFIGPTSQSPRVDEARSDTLYELEIAFEQMEAKLVSGKESEFPWLADRILRNFLVDLTGNTHRPYRTIRPTRIPRVRNAAACRNEPDTDTAATCAHFALLENAVQSKTHSLGHGTA
jgi:transglutaminase-like putative cysteine protease